MPDLSPAPLTFTEEVVYAIYGRGHAWIVCDANGIRIAVYDHVADAEAAVNAHNARDVRERRGWFAMPQIDGMFVVCLKSGFPLLIPDRCFINADPDLALIEADKFMTEQERK